MRLYVMDCSPFENAENRDIAAAAIGTQRMLKIQGLRDTQKQAQCAAAGWMLTHLFGDAYPPALTHDSRGKPYLADNSGRYFSLSHTGRWVFCAVDTCELGLDAQLQQKNRPAVAARCFTADEQTWLQAAPDERFTLLWTAKEAYVKYTGFGLVLPLHSFSVPGPAQGYDRANHCYWHSETRTLGEETVCITLCSEKAIQTPVWTQLTYQIPSVGNRS